METGQLLVGVGAVLVAAAAIIITIILALSKAVWTVSEKIGDTDTATREKIDEIRKELSAEAEKAHSGIGENINVLRKEMREDVGKLDSKIDRLSGVVNDTRSIVERIDTTLKERAPK